MRKKTEPPVNFAAKLSEAEWLFRGSLDLQRRGQAER
jgi:hypothetical protein